MQSTTLRTYLVIGILVLGVIGVYAPQLGVFAPERPAAASADRTVYVADLDFWQRSSRQTQISAKSRFDLGADLADVPSVIGDWTGQERPETNQEVEILLEPEQYVRRLYANEAGQYIWLSMIGGRSSQPFHAPDICYKADGWTFTLGSHATPLNDDGEVYGLWLEAEKLFPEKSEPTEHVVYYFYLFPDQERDLSDGIVLFKLTSPRYGTTEETLAMQGDFVRHLFFGLN